MRTLSDLVRDERSARMLLSLVGTPNDEATGRLLTRVGAEELIALADRDTVIPGMDRAEAAVWREHIRTHYGVDQAASLMAKSARYRFIIPDDIDWPSSLNDLGDRTPYGLWVNGNTDLLCGDAADRVTITGARAATGYGTFVAEEIASGVSEKVRTVVAGAAYGIEGSAHRAALAGGGSTIAVMASGIDRPYPAAHNQLLERIAQRGLVISEVPPGSAPTRQRFIDRARLQAALAGATVIVEAGAHSGSMGTAQEAQDLGRIVGAVPGPVTSAASYGTNQAIRDGRAQLVSGSFDFERLLVASESQQPPQRAFNQTHQHKQWHSLPRSITPQGM